MIVELRHTDIGYHLPIIRNISASLEVGEICLLIGNNGVGKTTLLKSIWNEIPILKGNILIENENISQLSQLEIAKKIAMVFSKAVIPEHYTTYDLIGLGKYVHYPYYIALNQEDNKEVGTIIKQLNLEQYQDSPLKNLSDGNLQKAFIGRALAQNTPILILDEPTTHLDENNKIAILDLLTQIAKNQRKTILFSSHDWRLARHFADKIWYLKNQTLYEGITEDIIIQHSELANYPEISNPISLRFPQIYAPKVQEELLLCFLKKQSIKDFSHWSFHYKNDFWQIKNNNGEFSAKNFYDIQKLF